MPRLTVSVLLSSVLFACMPDGQPQSTVTADGSASVDDSLTVTLQVVSSSPDNSDYPMTVRAKITGSKGAEYQLTRNGAAIESGRLPVTGTLVGGPFSGSEGPTNYRYAYFVIGEPGDQEIRVNVTQGGERVSDRFEFTLGAVCEANENFYANENLGNAFSCGNCHAQGGNASFVIDGSSYASISQVTKYQSSNPAIMAHMPANLDPTPEGNGGELTHSGGERWSQNSATHVRMLELAYRVSTDFSCP